MRSPNLLYLFPLCFLLLSCSSSHKVGDQLALSHQLPIAYQAFNTDQYNIISEESLFELNEQQKQVFLSYFEVQLAKGKQPNVILSDFLLGRLNNFNYFGETYAAEHAMRENKGNCMSLAILTTALAKLVGVELAYREVKTMPVFEKQGGLLLSSTHVQTKLFDSVSQDNRISTILTRAGLIIDYFPEKTNINSRFVSQNTFIGMYYHNKASDALIENKIDLAFKLAMKAYEYDSNSMAVLNLLAVLHRRVGELDVAEAIYQHARNIDKNNISILNNYIVLLNQKGRVKQAQILLDELSQLNDPNPYSWLEQAYLAYSKQKFRQAISYFNKTIELAPYVKQAYVGLHQAYKAKGQLKMANRALKQGLDWTYDESERQQLKYKLYGRNPVMSAFEEDDERS